MGVNGSLESQYSVVPNCGRSRTSEWLIQMKSPLRYTLLFIIISHKNYFWDIVIFLDGLRESTLFFYSTEELSLKSLHKTGQIFRDNNSIIMWAEDICVVTYTSFAE